MFKLHRDKKIIADLGDRKILRPFVLAGEYPIVRVFDNDRVIVDLDIGRRPRTLTLLRIEDGEITNLEKENEFSE